MIENWYLFIGIAIVIIAALPIIFFLIPNQIREVQRPSNNKRIKQYVLGIEIFIALTMLPGLPAAIQSLGIPPRNNAIKVANISNRLPFLGLTSLMLLTYFYVLKPEDDE